MHLIAISRLIDLTFSNFAQSLNCFKGRKVPRCAKKKKKEKKNEAKETKQTKTCFRIFDAYLANGVGLRLKVSYPDGRKKKKKTKESALNILLVPVVFGYPI